MYSTLTVSKTSTYVIAGSAAAHFLEKVNRKFRLVRFETNSIRYIQMCIDLNLVHSAPSFVLSGTSCGASASAAWHHQSAARPWPTTVWRRGTWQSGAALLVAFAEEHWSNVESRCGRCFAKGKPVVWKQSCLGFLHCILSTYVCCFVKTCRTIHCIWWAWEFFTSTAVLVPAPKPDHTPKTKAKFQHWIQVVKLDLLVVELGCCIIVVSKLFGPWNPIGPQSQIYQSCSISRGFCWSPTLGQHINSPESGFL